MFRIKNLRNTTVAKQTNISPPISRNQIANPLDKMDKKVISNKPAEIKEKSRIVIPKKITTKIGKLNLINENKINEKLDSKAPHLNLNISKKIQTIQNKDILHMNASKKQGYKLQKQMQIKDNKANIAQRESSQEIQVKTQKQDQFPQKPRLQAVKESIAQDKEESQSYQQGFQKFLKKEEQARKKAQDLQKEEQLEQIQKKKIQQRQKRRVERQRQAQKQRQRQMQLKKMTQKIHARKKARQEQYQRRRLKEQQAKKIQANEMQGGGIVTLSDPLAHIQMSQAMMDRQINRLLSMKFASFPNKQAIQHQMDELQRINRSYLLVREDPNNPLIRSLSNFRIQLFNRVGELVVRGQNQMGPQASGLQIIQTDHHHNNTNLIQGVKITRGLQNQIKKVLNTRKLKAEQECCICLGVVGSQQDIYNVKCGHIFHKNCLQEWLANTANCPACRYNIKYDHY